jgi:hypothetical protein
LEKRDYSIRKMPAFREIREERSVLGVIR